MSSVEGVWPQGHDVLQRQSLSSEDLAHVRVSRPDSGLGFQVKVLETCRGVPSSLGIGRILCIHGERLLFSFKSTGYEPRSNAAPSALGSGSEGEVAPRGARGRRRQCRSWKSARGWSQLKGTRGSAPSRRPHRSTPFLFGGIKDQFWFGSWNLRGREVGFGIWGSGF